MQHIYCTECGSKVSYSGAKPKFCSSCGTPIGGVATNKPSKKNKTRPTDNTEQSSSSASLKEDETDIDYVPNIGKLSYDIAQEGSGNKTYKFGDILNAEQKKNPAR